MIANFLLAIGLSAALAVLVAFIHAIQIHRSARVLQQIAAGDAL